MRASDSIRHVIWDWNGTLLDDVEACVAAVNRLMARRGLPAIDTRRYRDVFGFPVRNYYTALGFDLAREDWDALAREFHDAYAETAREAALRPGAATTLARLQRAGLPMDVLSACEQSILTAMLTARGVRPCFRRVCGLDDLYAHSKTELGRDLMTGIPLPPARVLLVGDTTHDAEVARELGCACLLVEGGHQSGARLRACGGAVVGELADVAGWIGG